MTVRKFQKASKEEKLNFMIKLITKYNSIDINSKEGWVISEDANGAKFRLMTGDGSNYCYVTTDKNMCKQLFAAKCYRHDMNMLWIKTTMGGN